MDPWTRHMLRGDFESAWQISDGLVRDGLHRPVWNGISFQGKRVLIRCVHGLGDTIQFIRYVRCLHEAGAVEISAQMHPPLVPLVGTTPFLNRAFGWDASAEFDSDIEVMELPWAFRTTADNVPATIPYLLPETVGQPLRRRGVEGRIGLVWSSSSWDISRSIPVHEFEALGRFCPVSLQHGPEHVQGASEPWLEYCGEQTSDLIETALQVQRLRLLITVDTMIAHLAGSLGIPVWVLLKKDADWRWIEGRCDCPWYPSMRLFRQTECGHWAIPIRRIAQAIHKDY